MHQQSLLKFGLCLLCFGITVSLSSAQDMGRNQADFANVLDIRPGGAGSKDGYFFTDLGDWHGYGLNRPDNQELMGGFRGPVVMLGRPGARWLSDVLERFSLSDEKGEPIPYEKILAAEYQPGRLVQSLRAGDFQVIQMEIAVSDRTTMTETRVMNTGKKSLKFKPGWNGTLTLKDAAMAADGNRLVIGLESGKRSCVVALPAAPFVNGAKYDASGEVVELAAGREQAFYSFTTYCPDAKIDKALFENKRYEASQGRKAVSENARRWQAMIDRVLSAKTDYLKQPANRDWAVKAMMTLNTNWRSAAGDLLHAGMYPGAGHFDGFWAWDSWIHAVAAAEFNPTLAKDQMRTMFDYQTPEGMIVDVIALDKSGNNNVCSKPPFAGWATYMVYQRTRDKEFLREMYPKLVKYHQWRFTYRDHDKNGLCEYGGTANQVHMGQWESGMDVAVKFDGVKMLENGPGAWSFDQESIELNSYLCAEKFYLAAMADVLGFNQDATRFRQEGNAMKEKIQTRFFDEETGFFYDIKLGTGEKVKVVDISGWIPLFTHVATPAQATRVKSVMLDPQWFGDYYPFSSLNHKHPKYDPEKGYFRGQTWINYAYYGIRGFKNYGFNEEASRLTALMPRKLAGLDQRGPSIRENYSSANGKGMGAEHFGWSSAFSLLLLTEDADRFPYVPDGSVR